MIEKKDIDEEYPRKGLAMSETLSLSSTSCWQKVLRSGWCRDMNDKRPQVQITTRFTCSEEKMTCALPFEPFFSPSWEAGVANVAKSPDFRQR